MSRWRLCLLALVMVFPPALQAQEQVPAQVTETIVSGLSQNRVAITADFDGSEILVYGAVKRDGPAPEGKIDVIITVTGPAGPLTVRRKDRVAGLWIKDASVTVDSAPGFYSVATTGPLDQILSATDNIRHRISIDQVIRAIGISAEADGHEDFIAALMRIYSAEGRYRVMDRAVQFNEYTLFRADIALPANLTEGQYLVRMFLLRDGRVFADQERRILVRKEGLERLVFNLSREQPLLYGLLSLALAVVAGWGASALFRLIRP